MQGINQYVTTNLSTFFFVLFILFLVMTVFLINVSIKFNKINKKYNTMMRGIKDKNLEEILIQHLKKVDMATNQVKDLEIQLQKMQKIAENSLQHVGIVRFNAFEDTGSDLSFAIALLDAHKDGVIISSIFSRHDSRIYAKPVKSGISNYNLSNEEQIALNDALKK